MGSSPSFGRLLGLERDLDLAFVGSTRDRRRRRMLGRIVSELRTIGIETTIRDGSPQHGSVFGEERVRLFNRTKIVLNIMRQPRDDVIFRMLLSAPNGAMLLSEPVFDPGPFVPGVHFVEAGPENLVQSIQYYLSHDKERERIAESARLFVTQDLTMRRMADRLLVHWKML
jgi:hypothetical protein